MSQTPPPGGPKQAPPPPSPYGTYQPGREGRPVSFYLAIFLALLLFVSGGLNLLLLVVTAGSGLGTVGGSEADGTAYEIVTVLDAAGTNDRILRIPVDGAISEMASPLMGASGGTVTRIRRALELAASQDQIKAVLIDINSPGGGVTDSDVIHRMIANFRIDSGKPVLALFGDTSASGGYYIAAACDRILARPTTITGSIGVIMSSYNYGEAAKKLGIDTVVIKSEKTPYKDMMSPTRPMEPGEKAILDSIVEEMYQRFVDVVDEGRPELDRNRIIELANGQIYSAGQAEANGLVDGLVNAEEAYEQLSELAGIPVADVVEHRRRPTLGELLFGVRSRVPNLEDSLAGLMQSTTGAKFLYYWPGGR
ncbi:MAG: signal peptide peptidase SppA [Planctomycetota bacterium]|jgi:protease-4